MVETPQPVTITIPEIEELLSAALPPRKAGGGMGGGQPQSPQQQAAAQAQEALKKLFNPDVKRGEELGKELDGLVRDVAAEQIRHQRNPRMAHLQEKVDKLKSFEGRVKAILQGDYGISPDMAGKAAESVVQSNVKRVQEEIAGGQGGGIPGRP